MRLGSIATTIKNNAGKYLKKGMGLAALGLVGYESHYIGKIQADRYATEKDAYKAGCHELDLCYKDGILDDEVMPDDYIIDTIKLPVSQVPTEVLKACGLGHLI